MTWSKASAVLFLLLVGCQSQPTNLANPFLAPDHVPPPATRSATPAAAQPYYPGAATPPPAHSPPQNYSPPPVQMPPAAAPTGTFPTTPPGANAYPQSSQAPPAYGVTFDSWSGVNTEQLVQAAEVAAAPPAVQVATATQPVNAPRSDMNVQPANYQPTPPPFSAVPATVGNWEQPVVGQPKSQSASAPRAIPIGMAQTAVAPTPNLRAAELRPAQEFKSVDAVTFGGASVEVGGPGALSSRATSVDGFRARGTRDVERPTAAAGVHLAGSTPQVVRRMAPYEQYGAGTELEWLAGRLEFEPTSNQWRIRYRDPAAPGGDTPATIAIGDTRSLRGFREGDFIVVRGRVIGIPLEAGKFQRRYNIATIRRLNQI